MGHHGLYGHDDFRCYVRVFHLQRRYRTRLERIRLLHRRRHTRSISVPAWLRSGPRMFWTYVRGIWKTYAFVCRLLCLRGVPDTCGRREESRDDHARTILWWICGSCASGGRWRSARGHMGSCRTSLRRVRVCVQCFCRSRGRTHCRWIRDAELFGLEMDGVVDADPGGIVWRHRTCLDSRDECTQDPANTGEGLEIPDEELGATREGRRATDQCTLDTDGISGPAVHHVVPGTDSRFDDGVYELHLWDFVFTF